MAIAWITGITDQDGAYLVQLLLGKGYQVVGFLSRSASSNVVGERLRWLGMAVAGLRVVRARPFNHCGRDQSDSFVVAAFARQIALIAAGRQLSLPRVGDLSPMRDFMDVRDICTGYATCIAAAEALPQGAILNLASGSPRRIADVLEDLLHAAGVSAESLIDPERLRATNIPFACGNAGRARTLLGWAPAVPWPETVAAVARYWRDRVRHAAAG